MNSVSKINIKHWILILSVLLLPIIADQTFKSQTSSIKDRPVVVLQSIGLFSSFSRAHNQKLLSHPVIRNTRSFVHITFGLFIILIFIALNLIFIYKHLLVRCLLALSVGSLLSRSLDHIFYGEYMDNVAIVMNHSIVSFNSAVVLFILSVACFLLILTFKRKLIFKTVNIRSHFLIPKNPNQRQFLFYVMIAYGCVFISVFFIVSLYFYLAILHSLPDEVLTLVNREVFTLGLSAYLSIFIFIYMISVFLSNRIYGPVHGFQNHMKKLFESGDKAPVFKIRKKDQFRELESIAEYIRTRILKKL